MSEEWRSIPGYQHYEVSSTGKVRSRANGAWRLRKPKLHKGYIEYNLWSDGRGRNWGLHQLLALAFIGPRPEGMQVRHLDGNPLNNDLGNLRYGTATEQRLDDVRNGVHPWASKTHCAQGHKFTPENTYVGPGKKHRKCRICTARRLQEFHERKRAAKAMAS